MRYWLKSLAFGGGLPVVFLFLVLIAFVFRKRRLAWALALGSLFVTSWFVFPGGANLIAKPLYTKAHQLDHSDCVTDPLCQAGAIVIPSSGLNQYGFLWEESWWRTKKGVELWKANKALVIVFSGGSPGPNFPLTGAETMAEEAKRLGVPQDKILLENDARNTRDNAIFTFSLLKPLGIKKILLVTTRLHLPRANATFLKAGFETIAIAADPIPKEDSQKGLRPFSWSHAVYCESVLNEYLGYAVYKLMGWL